MANRHNRDEILHRALNLADSPSLDEKDRPGGAILDAAITLGFLQDGIDHAYTLFPVAGTIKSVPLTFTAGVDTYSLPTDYLLDYQDGIVLGDDKARLIKRGWSYLVGMGSKSRQYPRVYAVVANQLKVRPIPDTTYTATLYYYSLPSELGPNDVPVFPSSWTLVEYVRLRCMEWLKESPPGTAMAFMDAQMSKLAKSGQGVEAEPDQIPLDRHTFGMYDADRDSWMGPTTT